MQRCRPNKLTLIKSEFNINQNVSGVKVLKILSTATDVTNPPDLIPLRLRLITETRLFRKRSSNQVHLKTPSFRLRVLGKDLENRAFGEN